MPVRSSSVSDSPSLKVKAIPVLSEAATAAAACGGKLQRCTGSDDDEAVEEEKVSDSQSMPACTKGSNQYLTEIQSRPKA